MRLFESAISGDGGLASWMSVGVAIVFTLLLYFLRSYLKRKGEDIAIRQKEVLKRLEKQTTITEEISHKFENQLEQESFVRELYAPDIKEYSSKQAHALRQAYLLVFEPDSSDDDIEGKDLDDFEKRVDMATDRVMQPLREYIGVLDESTIKRIYDIKGRLSDLRGIAHDESYWSKKQDFFNETEVARQSIKAPKIAFRLGLISRPLVERKADEE